MIFIHEGNAAFASVATDETTTEFEVSLTRLIPCKLSHNFARPVQLTAGQVWLYVSDSSTLPVKGS